MPNAVIFDLDGTLIITEDLWRQAEIQCFAEVGVTLTEHDCKETIGVRIDQVVEYWRGRRSWSSEASDEALVEAIVNRVADLFAENPSLREGARDLIEHLSARGIPLAVASASPQRLIERNLEAVGVKQLFQVIHSAEFEVAGKPDPAVFLTAARRLGVMPKDCVVFEDSLNGIRAANAAGTLCIAIQEDATPFNEASSLADFAIETYVGFTESIVFREVFG